VPLRTLAADCSQCGRSSDVEVTRSRWRGNEAIDPDFGLPLRLVEKTAAGLLWAYNAEHLQALHDYARATLREGSGHHRSMFSRLPQWMKLARNRVLLQRGGGAFAAAIAAGVVPASGSPWPPGMARRYRFRAILRASPPGSAPPVRRAKRRR
jgi:hypothetical protein